MTLHHSPSHIQVLKPEGDHKDCVHIGMYMLWKPNSVQQLQTARSMGMPPG